MAGKGARGCGCDAMLSSGNSAGFGAGGDARGSDRGGAGGGAGGGVGGGVGGGAGGRGNDVGISGGVCDVGCSGPLYICGVKVGSIDTILLMTMSNRVGVSPVLLCHGESVAVRRVRGFHLFGFHGHAY